MRLRVENKHKVRILAFPAVDSADGSLIDWAGGREAYQFGGSPYILGEILANDSF